MTEVENDVKLACCNFFIATAGYYPRSFTLKSSIDTTIKNLLIFEPGNNKISSALVSMRENYNAVKPKLLKDSKVPQRISMKRIQNLIPKGAILSPSDKNLGISLLSPAWFEKEYTSQDKKGGYEKQSMSETVCITMLLSKISSFRQNLTKDQKKILSTHWPRFPPPEPMIGVLKLVPKIHKITGKISAESWTVLLSRPIRGAENDSMKMPSKALYSMLQEMLSKFLKIFPSVNCSNQSNNFTVLKGCDDYCSRLGSIKLDSSMLKKQY